MRPPFLARVMGVRSALTTTMSSGDLRWRERGRKCEGHARVRMGDGAAGAGSRAGRVVLTRTDLGG